MSEILQINHLSQSYVTGRPVLNDVSFCVERGRIVGVVGPNGCGKTTMFKIIAGLLHSYQGDVQVAGTAPGFASKALVSYLPEKTYLGDMIRIRDALAFFQDFYRDFDRVKALELIKRFNLEPDMKIKSMSKGMQEKLQLVLVMCRDAELYVLDEPLSGIDPAARDMILDVILHNYSENSSILLSTHLIYDVERIFDDVVIMDYGRLVTAASADALREQSGLSLNDYFREVFKC